MREQAGIAPQSVMQRLSDLADELNDRSLQLARVERELEPAQREYEDWLTAHELGLWDAHVNDGDKFPPEKVRERLALRTMDGAVRSRRDTLVAQRKRLEQRIRDLKAEVDAQRSILSALKLEMEATG